MVISIFLYEQFLECFCLSLVLLTDAKLKPAESKCMSANVMYYTVLKVSSHHSGDSP